MPPFLPVSSTRFYNGGKNITIFKIPIERHNNNNNNTFIKHCELEPFSFLFPRLKESIYPPLEKKAEHRAGGTMRLQIAHQHNPCDQRNPSIVSNISWNKLNWVMLIYQGKVLETSFQPLTLELLPQNNNIGANQSYQCIIKNNNNNEDGTLMMMLRQHSWDRFGPSCAAVSESRSR